jgi:TadE-like protein
MGSSGRLFLWAAIAPLLLLVVLGITDFGGAFWQQRTLGEAAFEGTKWGKAYGYDPSKITAVAQAATNLHRITVAPFRPCGCAGPSGITQAECNSACPGGGWSQPYIVVTTSMCYSPALTWPGISYCSSGSSQCLAASCSPSQILLSAQSLTLQ